MYVLITIIVVKRELEPSMETEELIKSIKVEPEEDIITVAEPQPCSSASLFDECKS